MSPAPDARPLRLFRTGMPCARPSRRRLHIRRGAQARGRERRYAEEGGWHGGHKLENGPDTVAMLGF